MTAITEFWAGYFVGIFAGTALYALVEWVRWRHR